MENEKETAIREDFCVFLMGGFHSPPPKREKDNMFCCGLVYRKDMIMATLLVSTTKEKRLA